MQLFNVIWTKGAALSLVIEKRRQRIKSKAALAIDRLKIKTTIPHINDYTYTPILIIANHVFLILYSIF
jgi:hypothetical protein